MSFYQDKTVLVTGAAGFIGSHLTDRLLAEGAIVVGVDNFITGNKQNLQSALSHPKFTLIEADVIDSPSTYLPTLNSHLATLSCIFHLASPASPPGYQKKPIETYLVNSIGTHNLLQFVLESSPTARVLYTSTSEIYGDPLEHPQKETYFGNVDPNGPRSMYDESKRLGETICGVHINSFQLDIRIARLFNVYGPRMDINDGRVIPEYFKSVQDHKSLPVEGTGSQTRSFCFIDDMVTALLRLMEVDQAAGQTVNLGNPSEITMKQLAEQVIAVTGTTETITSIQARPGDPQRRCPDITKAKNLLKWEPTVELSEGLLRTWEYFKNQKNAS